MKGYKVNKDDLSISVIECEWWAPNEVKYTRVTPLGSYSIIQKLWTEDHRIFKNLIAAERYIEHHKRV